MLKGNTLSLVVSHPAFYEGSKELNKMVGRAISITNDPGQVLMLMFFSLKKSNKCDGSIIS